MPKRQRWTPIKGTANRIYDPWERLALAALDLPLRAIGPSLPRGGSSAPRSILVLRLDRMGDLVMSLPALSALREALPDARIRLAVGTWSAALAATAPVDEVLVWSAPWVGRAQEGAEGYGALFSRARKLRADPPDLAFDLQGDIRAILLMAATGARRRVGYANTGGGALLTDVLPWDETVSWVEQNLRAIRGVFPGAAPTRGTLLLPEERARGEEILRRLGVLGKRPLVGLHPSGGRAVKEWDRARWAALAGRLARDLGATILVTGGASDRELSRVVLADLGSGHDLAGALGIREMLSLLAHLDLFVSSDTGPMHMACAVGTPSLSLFGPTDPVRYFSGAVDSSPTPHRVLRADLWCSPCNLVRKPPRECAVDPECLRLLSADQVFEEAASILGAAGGR
jgi:heptosyltransferase-2/heptosyltransferase-3